MGHIWRFRITLTLIVGGLATWAWAETIEFVTYYPSPTAPGTAHSQSMAIGTGYQAVTPTDGELIVFDRLGVGPGFDVAAPAGRLHVAGAANEAATALFMPGAGGTMNVGIGTTAPTQKLHVIESTANVWAANIQGNTHGLYASGPVRGLYGETSGSGIGTYYGLYAYGAYYGGYFQNGNYWNPALFAYNGASGYWAYIGYGYYGMYTNGYVYGILQNASSIDRKKSVSILSPQEETSILSEIQKFPLVHFRWKQELDDSPLRLGVIAEWTPKELTSTDGKAVDVSACAAYSLAGVKALSVQVKKQQETIETQQEELRQLKQQFQQLQQERAQ